MPSDQGAGWPTPPWPPRPATTDGRRRSAATDPPWVWTSARLVTVLMTAVLAVIAVGLIVLIVDDVRDANRPGRVNDDGTGAAAMVGIFGLVFLLPILVVSVVAVVLAAARHRSVLVFLVLVGGVGTLLGIGYTGDHPVAGLVLTVAFAAALVIGVSGLTLTSPAARQQRAAESGQP